MKAVFDSKSASIYDDDLTRHYQFPSNYLSVVQSCIGDWIVFRRPKRGGGDMAYFAVARVRDIEPDVLNPKLFYARLEEFWQFDHPVPWKRDGHYWEEDLRNVTPQEVGARMRGVSVRRLSEADFAHIVMAGFDSTLSIENASRLGLARQTVAAANADLKAPLQPRRIEQVLTNRTIREASFRATVCKAYDSRCAITGLRIFDRNGNAEVQAAHIWSVADGGPDVLQNGIALSATLHWLFDRHMITIGNDNRLILAKNEMLASFLPALIYEGAVLKLPLNESDRPHPSYIQKHQETFLAKNKS